MLAPTFDHASSLGRSETDANRSKRLITQDRGGSVEAYVARARSGFFETPAAHRTMTTLETFMATARVRPQASRYWIEALFGLSSSDFAMRVLEANRERLLKVVSEG